MTSDKAPELIVLCRERKLRIVTAESCTGGLIGGALTEIPGSSDVFWGGFLVYDNDAKVRMLQVPPEMLDREGAVSEPVVRRMLQGAMRQSGADLALAVSGVAGPGGGTPEKPVGTVWIGVAMADGRECLRKYHFGGNRREVRLETVKNALFMAEKIILNESCLDSE